MMKACVWTKENTYCETHCCGFADPCLVVGCPHCDSTSDRRYTRWVTELGKVEARIEWDEERLLRLLRLLAKNKQRRKMIKKRLAKMEEERRKPEDVP